MASGGLRRSRLEQGSVRGLPWIGRVVGTDAFISFPPERRFRAPKVLRSRLPNIGSSAESLPPFLAATARSPAKLGRSPSSATGVAVRIARWRHTTGDARLLP